MSPRRERLVVAGRDKTKLIDGVASQAAVVASVLADACEDAITVYPLLCFVDGNFPFLRMPVVNGIRVVTPKVAARCRTCADSACWARCRRGAARVKLSARHEGP